MGGIYSGYLECLFFAYDIVQAHCEFDFSGYTGVYMCLSYGGILWPKTFPLQKGDSPGGWAIQAIFISNCL